MVTKELSRAATEVNIILENSTSDVKNKIPQSFKEFLKDIEDKTYSFNYDTNKRLNEQKISNLTRGIITLIYKDYLCKDREGYLKELDLKLKKQDTERKEKNKNYKIINKVVKENKQIILAEKRKENFLARMLKRVQNVLKINKKKIINLVINNYINFDSIKLVLLAKF